MKVLVYLLYGDKQEYQLELAFSMISALRFLKKSQDSITISVMTDRPNLLSNFGFDLPIDQVMLSQDEIAIWTQAGSYNHRAKIFALLKALDHYQAPVALVDTDTYFISSPAQLFDRISPVQSVMHDFEYKIGDRPLWRPIVEQIVNGLEFEGMTLSPQSPMFNSGVVGIDPANRSLLEQSLRVLDKVYSLSPIFNVEQFALGIVLNQHTNLSLSADIVKHYWGLERDFIHLQSSRLLANSTSADLESLLVNLESLELGCPSKSFKDRTVSRLLALIKRWDDDYRFAHLSYRCALSYAAKDAGYANAWAKVALSAMQSSIDATLRNPERSRLKFAHRLSSMQRDFRKFNPSHIDALRWLEPSVRRDWLEFWQQHS